MWSKECMGKKNFTCHDEVNIQCTANAKAKWHHPHLELIPVSLAFTMQAMLAACHHAELIFSAQLLSAGNVGRNGLTVETLLCEHHWWRRQERGRRMTRECKRAYGREIRNKRGLCNRKQSAAAHLIPHFYSIGYFKPPLTAAYHLVCVAKC